MGVLEDIAAVDANGSLTPDEKKAQRAILRASEMEARILERLPITRNLTIRGNTTTVTITAVVRSAGMVRVEGSDTAGWFDWPIQVVNPPILAVTPGGPIQRNGVRFALDGAEALAQVLLAHANEVAP